MRAASTALLLLLTITLVSTSVSSAAYHQTVPQATRDAPGPGFMTKHGLQMDERGLVRMRLADAVAQKTEPYAPLLPLGPTATLNCGNDNIIDAAGTLVLQADDAAGTAFAPVPGFTDLIIESVRFGVLDFGASYPGTMYVDFWESTGPGQWDFVVGIDVVIPTNPELTGDLYDVDVSASNIMTNNELMVLVYDGAPGPGVILPAGDSSQSCFDGVNFCSVLLPAGGGGLFLYGIQDAQACPAGVNNIQLYDLVLEVDYSLDSPTDVPSPSLGYALHDAQPNPFNPRTMISYRVPREMPGELVIYDAAGRRVRTLISGTLSPGPKQVSWDGTDDSGHLVSSGVYLYRLETPEFEETKRMVLLK